MSPANARAGKRGKPASTPRASSSLARPSVKTNMTPLRGWGPRGRRLVSKVNHGHWKR